MKQKVANHIKDLLNVDIVLERPKDISFGDFAIPIFRFAKIYRKELNIIGDEFIAKLNSSGYFYDITFLRGFINFRISSKFMSEFIAKRSSEIKSKDGNILVEFVSANPTGPLHIGHARGAIFGDTLIRAGKYLGYKITGEYYVNDAGNQITLLGESLKYSIDKYILKKDVSEPEEYYRGEYINTLAKKLYDSDPTLSTNSERLSSLAKDEMLCLIKKDLANINVYIDDYITEKSMMDECDSTLAELKKSGGSYTKDGKLWLKTKQNGDEFDRVMIRDNGEPTYMLGDLIYHKNKFDRGYSKCINIWGADHHGYIARIEASINYLGYDSKNLEVLITQMVSLLKDKKPYKMSKRAGNFIIMSDVANDIGTDLLRFIFLSKKADTHLEFDVSDFNSSDNPVIYIKSANYKLSKSLEGFINSELYSSDLAKLSLKFHQLAVESLLVSTVIEDMFDSRETQKLTEYVKNLASQIHSIYSDDSTKSTLSNRENQSVLFLAKESIETSLSVLGIEV